MLRQECEEMGFRIRTGPLDFGPATSLVYAAGFMKHEVFATEKGRGFFGPYSREEMIAKFTHFPPVSRKDGGLTEIVTIYVYNPRIIRIAYFFTKDWQKKYGANTVRRVDM